MTSSDSDVLDDVPDQVATVLEDSTDSQLRAIIEYAHELLHDKPSLEEAADERPGEELVRVENKGAYTIAIVERPDETGDARGPVAYRVRWVPDLQDRVEDDVENEGGQYEWQYLGTVADCEGNYDD